MFHHADHLVMLRISLAIVLLGTACAELQAGCRCKGHRRFGAALLPVAPMPFPGAAHSGAAGMPPGFVPGFGGTFPPLEPVTPPPGTLGQTYQLRSKPVPVEMHPRVAMLDVYVPGALSVYVNTMNPYRTEDLLEGFQDPEDPNLWHFQTDSLYPGLTHIYRVEAALPGPAGPVQEERYVRLIMGRVIELRF